jgi:primosomal protein N' (replication factor Y)
MKKQVSALLKVVERTSWQNGQQNPILKRDIVAEGISESSINSLSKKEILNIFSAEISRLSLDDSENNEIKELTGAQSDAYKEIKSYFEPKRCRLIKRGNLFRKKLRFYVKLITEILEQGRQVFILVARNCSYHPVNQSAAKSILVI